MRDHVTRAAYAITDLDGTVHTGTTTLYGPITHPEATAALRQTHHVSADAVVRITPKKGLPQ